MARQAAKDAGKLTEYPKRKEVYSSPPLAGAAETTIALDIARGKRAPKSTEPSAAEVAMLAKLEAATEAAPEPAAPVARPLRLQETSHQRFRRALALEATLAEGGTIATEDALWLGSYRDGSEYRAHKRLHEDFGTAVLR
jgi:hypothetical protein